MATAINYLPMALFMAFSLYVVARRDLASAPEQLSRIYLVRLAVALASVVAVALLALVVFEQWVPLLILAVWLLVLAAIVAVRYQRGESRSRTRR